jgi:hypothetical protein
MQKLLTKILTGIMLLSCLILYADEPEKVGVIASKAILQNSDGYFVFADGSCWKIVTFQKRWRTLSEWWNNQELIPQNYDTIPKNWFIGAEVLVYPKSQMREVDEKNASNREKLKQCTHMLVNSKNDQVLFAIALHPADCLSHLFQDAHKEGYDEGYSEGMLSRGLRITSSFQEGYNEGHKAGYQKGYQAATQGLPEAELCD